MTAFNEALVRDPEAIGYVTKAAFGNGWYDQQASSSRGLAELAAELTTNGQQIPYGPGIPVAPMLPESTEPRRFDYPVGFNIPATPRTYEPISFGVLQSLARNYDVAQLAIQKRIDGLRRLTWSIRPMPITGMSRRDAQVRAARLADRIAAATGFLSTPDQEHEWSDWLARMAYDIFTIDAAAIYLRPTMGGELYGLELIDGTTIRPLIDGYGRPPAPPIPAFMQVIKGINRQALTSEELLYAPYWGRTGSAYGHPPLEWVILAVNRALRRQTLDLALYTDGNMPVAFLKVAADLPGSQLKELKQLLDETIAGNDVARSRIIPIPGGAGTGLDKVNPEPSTEAEQFLMHLTCAAIGVSPSELGFVEPGTGLGGKGFAELQNKASRERDEGLAAYIAGKINRIIATPAPYGLGEPELRFFWDDFANQGDRLAEAQAWREYWEMGATTSDWIAENILDQDPPGLGPVVVSGGTVTRVQDVVAPPQPGTTPAPGTAPAEQGGPEAEDVEDATPNAAMGSDTAGEPSRKAAASADLARWQRKAERNVGSARALRFDSSAIPAPLAGAIRERLAKAATVGDVREVFATLAKADPNPVIPGEGLTGGATAGPLPALPSRRPPSAFAASSPGSSMSRVARFYESSLAPSSPAGPLSRSTL